MNSLRSEIQKTFFRLERLFPKSLLLNDYINRCFTKFKKFGFTEKVHIFFIIF